NWSTHATLDAASDSVLLVLRLLFCSGESHYWRYGAWTELHQGTDRDVHGERRKRTADAGHVAGASIAGHAERSQRFMEPLERRQRDCADRYVVRAEDAEKLGRQLDGARQKRTRALWNLERKF